MPVRYLTHIIVCLFMASVWMMQGCHSNNSPTTTSGFKDERAIRATLSGTWILREYEDSIDAGLTPKLLELMLGPKSIISYEQGHLSMWGLYPSRRDTTEEEHVFSEEFELGFDAATQKLIITVSENEEELTVDSAGRPNSQRAAKNKVLKVDTAEILVDGGDTVLRLHMDSSVHDFVKYDVGKCKDIVPYAHLVNSKFIAGRYYALSDTGRLHHIIFTKCGSVEGVENILPELNGYSGYAVELTNFSTFPDAIFFYNPAYKLGRTYYWEVSVDSLKLHTDYLNRHNEIITLIKAR